MADELSDKDRERALSRYRNMRGRRDVKLSFKTMGPVVKASTPEELERAATEALVEESKKVLS